jgi:hypothetical protein
MGREVFQDGSRSAVETKDDAEIKSPVPDGTLRLRSEPTRSRVNSSRVSWTANTVDNEHMNKKKSNRMNFWKCEFINSDLVCCIFHPKEDSDCPHRSDEPDPNAWNAYERQPNHHSRPPQDPQ